MSQQPYTLITVDETGHVTSQQLPGDTYLDMEQAMADSDQLRSGIFDSECPICAAMEEAGLETPSPHRRINRVNRTQRRAEAAMARRRRRKVA